MRRLVVALGLVGAAGAVVLGLSLRQATPVAAQTDTTAPATAKVQRRDLVQRETLDGTLGYAGTYSVAGRGSGTVTWLPREGSVASRGKPLFAIDNQRTYLMYGRIPAYRDLSMSSEDGPDILQLERNLVALGYADPDVMNVDDNFTSATRSAVKEWQEDVGDDETGVVPLGRVVFTKEAVRVGSHKVRVGDAAAPGAALLEVSRRALTVTIALEASKTDLVSRGERVDVELPSGRRVRGRVTSVGTVATTNGDGETTVDVSVSVPRRAAAFDQAPVDVYVAASAARDVLAVPVTALLALSEGGYAVEAVEDGRRRLVAVEVGSYADGFVEVRGEGIAEGMSVVVAE